jgi:hypothetical protein
VGSSEYKTIDKGTYKIDWISGDTAIVTYKANDKSALQQSFFSFKSTDYISYKNVAVSLTGKWFEKDTHNNYLMYNGGKIVYAKEGQLYYYDIAETKQQGVTSLIVSGDDTRPSFTVVLNSDCIIGDDGLIKAGGTITLSPITLEKEEGKVYNRE